MNSTTNKTFHTTENSSFQQKFSDGLKELLASLEYLLSLECRVLPNLSNPEFFGPQIQSSFHLFKGSITKVVDFFNSHKHSNVLIVGEDHSSRSIKNSVIFLEFHVCSFPLRSCEIELSLVAFDPKLKVLHPLSNN